MTDQLWLPTGAHWDLNIEHKEGGNAGPFAGGGHKFVWHTTESSRESVDAMVGVVSAKKAEPHFVIGWRNGWKYPVVVQMVPLNRSARTMRHPSGPETNRANAIQVEICGRASESGDWDKNWYRALSNLALLVDHRFNIPVRWPKSTSRMGGQQFFAYEGHCGHMHAPGNDHVDPGTGFRWKTLHYYLVRGRQEIAPRKKT